MTDWKLISEECAKPLDNRHVKEPAPGKYGQYIEGWHAIDEANTVFGFGGWSYSVDTLVKTNQSEKDGKHHTGYAATVTVTVDGVARQDVGHGQGHAKAEGDAHEGAIKEAVTDALKRALRTFGYRFGLALYDKTKSNVVDGAEAERIDAAKETYEDLFVQLQETDDMALDGFGASHAAKINSLKGTEYFEKIKGDVAGRKAKREPQENAA
jgi:DNA recombination protein Rad52